MSFAAGLLMVRYLSPPRCTNAPTPPGEQSCSRRRAQAELESQCGQLAVTPQRPNQPC